MVDIGSVPSAIISTYWNGPMDGADTQSDFGGVLGGPRLSIAPRLGAASKKSLGSTGLEYLPGTKIPIFQVEFFPPKLGFQPFVRREAGCISCCVFSRE